MTKMTKHRSLLRWIALFTALSIHLSGCGAQEKPIDLTLALRAGVYSEIIKSCLAEYEASHNVHCTVLELSEEDLHSLVVEDAENQLGKIDFCMVDGSWMAEYTANGILANLSDMKYELDSDIIPATTEICYYEGDLYLAPFYGNVTVLLYNRALVEAAGYSGEDEIGSLEDIRRICLAAQDAGRDGFLYRGDTENNLVVDFLPILLSCGGWVVDENGRPTVDTPEFRNAVDFYLELIGTGGDAPKEDLVAAIDEGSAAMGIGWPGWYTPSDESGAAYLALSGKEKGDSAAYNANVYGVWAIGIPYNSKNMWLAEDLMEYIMDPEVQLKSVEAGGVPCRYSCLLNEQVVREHPNYRIVCAALENGTYRPIIEEWPEFYTILGEELRGIFDGEQSVESGLAKAQGRLEELFR